MYLICRNYIITSWSAVRFTSPDSLHMLLRVNEIILKYCMCADVFNRRLKKAFLIFCLMPMFMWTRPYNSAMFSDTGNSELNIEYRHLFWFQVLQFL